MENRELVTVFKALADENRIQILRLLQPGEKCACDLLSDLNISQPTLSHHMRILTGAGIVQSRKEGKWMHYSISEEKMKDILQYLHSLQV